MTRVNQVSEMTQIPSHVYLRILIETYGLAQMTTLLLQNTGRIVFPTYEIIRHAHIFRHKVSL